MRKLLAVFAVGVVCSVCAWAATSPVGTWKGGFHGDLAKLPAQPDAESQRQLSDYIKMLKSMRCSMKIKSDHTFTMDITGTREGKTETHRMAGTWKLDGRAVVTTNLKRDGKALDPTAHAQNRLALSKNEKTLTFAYGQMIHGAIVLKRM